MQWTDIPQHNFFQQPYINNTITTARAANRWVENVYDYYDDKYSKSAYSDSSQVREHTASEQMQLSAFLLICNFKDGLPGNQLH